MKQPDPSDLNGRPPIRVSGCIVACNEGDRIGACVDSLEFCDELLVIDSGSTDDTVRQARARGARVVAREWHGFAAQKQFAIQMAEASDDRVGSMRNAMHSSRPSDFEHVASLHCKSLAVQLECE